MTDKIIGRLLIVEGSGGVSDCEKCALSGTGTGSDHVNYCVEGCEPCAEYNDADAYFINDEYFKESK